MQSVGCFTLLNAFTRWHAIGCPAVNFAFSSGDNEIGSFFEPISEDFVPFGAEFVRLSAILRNQNRPSRRNPLLTLHLVARVLGLPLLCRKIAFRYVKAYTNVAISQVATLINTVLN